MVHDTFQGSIIPTVSPRTAPTLWVTNWGVGMVTELNASDGSLVQTIPVGIGPEGVSSDGTHVWVANSESNTVTEFPA